MRKSVMFLTACLMLTLSSGLAAQTPLTESPMMLRSECEKELTALEQTAIEQVTKLEARYDELLKQQSIECEATVRAATTRAAADVAKPLLIEIAGLRAERDAVARQRVWWGLGGIMAGLVAGIFIGILGG